MWRPPQPPSLWHKLAREQEGHWSCLKEASELCLPADSCLIDMTHLLIRFGGKHEKPHCLKAVLSCSYRRQTGLNSAEHFRLYNDGKTGFGYLPTMSFVPSCKQNLTWFEKTTRYNCLEMLYNVGNLFAFSSESQTMKNICCSL